MVATSTLKISNETEESKEEETLETDEIGDSVAHVAHSFLHQGPDIVAHVSLGGQTNGRGRGRPVDECFQHFHRGQRKSHGHYEGKCIYCNKHFSRAKAGNFRAHLAEFCTKVPKNVRMRFHRLLNQPLSDILTVDTIGIFKETDHGGSGSSRKRKSLGNKNTTKSVTKRTNLSPNTYKPLHIQQHPGFLTSAPGIGQVNVEHASRTLLRAFVTGDIPFHFAENPYFQEFCQTISLSSFHPPTSYILQDKEIYEEARHVTLALNKIIDQCENVALAIYQLPSNPNIYIWSVILKQKATLVYQIKTCGVDVLVDKFLFEETKKIMDHFAPDKFSALVYNTTTRHSKLESTFNTVYPHIIHIRSAPYFLRVLTEDLMKTSFLKTALNQAYQLVKFFKCSSLWRYRFDEGRKELKIEHIPLVFGKSGVWSSIYDMCYSVLFNRDVFTAISSRVDIPNEILLIIDQRKFWMDLEIAKKLLFVSKEVHDLTVSSESTTTLVDFHVYFMVIAKQLNNMTLDRSTKNVMIKSFNRRWKEYNGGSSILKLCFFLHPGYRGVGLRESYFREIMGMAGSLWKSMGNSEISCMGLMTQLKAYEDKLPPYAAEFDWKKDNCSLWWLRLKDFSGNQLRDLAGYLHGIATDMGGLEETILGIRLLQEGKDLSSLNSEMLGGFAKIYTWSLYYIRENTASFPPEITNGHLREMLGRSLGGSKDEIQGTKELLIGTGNAVDELIYTEERNTTRTIDLDLNEEYDFGHDIFDTLLRSQPKQISRGPNSVGAVTECKGIDQPDYDVMSMVEKILGNEKKDDSTTQIV